ncbi:MAG: TonB-dependent receptor [Marinilabiliaceae bacterium]|nr:TonB-dependent receptor [Marinilabiliaceae bacterium]
MKTTFLVAFLSIGTVSASLHGQGDANAISGRGLQQEERTVSGSVTDAKGQPIPGVSVVIQGTTTGTITDLDGNYNLLIEDNDAEIVFSFIGFVNQEVLLGDRTKLDVVLDEEVTGLDEVVVVGYGAQKKANLTGSVSTVDFSKQAESRPVTSVSSALSGLTSGVTVRQGVGKPGEDGASIRIRGMGTLNDNSPLVIIDGMEGVLDAVNPDDIASISILKDAASSAIYGSRAANGVILVTTKKGKSGATTVTYSGNLSIASPSNILEFVSDYPTYMRLINESARNIGSSEHFSQGTIDAWEAANANPNGLNENGVPNWVAFPNTNWSTEMYESNVVQQHSLSINGGSEKSSYLLSLGYLDNPGLVQNTGIKRYNLRINLESEVTDWLKVGTRTYAIQQDKDLGNYKDMLNYARQSTPGLIGEYNGQYGFPEAPEESATANNLYGFLNNKEGDDRLSRFNTTVYSEVSVLNGLTWNMNVNYARRFDEYNNHTNAKAGERIKFSDGTIMSPAVSPDLMTTYYKTYANESYTFENLLRYEKTFADDHAVNALLGYNENRFFAYDHKATKKGLIDQSVSTLGSATEMLSIDGGANDYAIRSWFGRLNYAYKQRYLFEANYRYDGSSRFHEDTRWGLFPSFSAAWRISEENFMKDLVPDLQNLKLRASWGQLGNNVTKRGSYVDNYAYQAVYGSVGYSLGGAQVAGLRPTIIANPALEWESTTMTNIGLDFMTFSSRLSAEIDYYNKVTDGILTTPPIPMTAGLIGAPIKNTAEVSNKGLEFTLGWRDQIGEVEYSVSGNFSYNKNEVTKYKGKLVEGWETDDEGNEYYASNLGDVSTGGRTRILEGHMINEYRLLSVYNGNGSYFQTDGTVNPNGGPQDGMIRTEADMQWMEAMVAAGNTFYPNQHIRPNGIWYGDYIYADTNGDGKFGNSYDRSFTGTSSVPKYNFGATINLSWKNFDLGMVWSGQAGYELYWNEDGYNGPNLRTGNQIGQMLVGNHYYYNPDEPNDPATNIHAEYPRLKLSQGDPQNIQESRAWLYDAAYIKLRNLTIGYTLPKRLANKALMKSARIYFSAENLLTITSFPGLDPEMSANTNYPIMKQISVGTNITF